ncbi:tumor necrosis factor-like [Hemicordylus capensis]|uniref:tumor necrosis factor-like n=1 Tax=Hemicordylus capensis TaxID=884348 RepID=UPI002302E29E|nr:tumor necrosis factor-like [Hemicordylus capensis]
MSSEHLVYDVEKGSKVVVVGEKPSQEGRWKCLSICSFLLLIGAVAVFAVLQFGAFRKSANQDSIEKGNSFLDGLPQTMKVQAVTSRKPVAHAIASLKHSNKLVWTTDVAPAMLNNIVLSSTDNALVIPSDGLYFVYSQLMFHGANCGDSLLLSHTIKSWSTMYNGEVELLKSIKSVCEVPSSTPNHKKLWFESIYQGAVFKLMKGDRLWSQTESAQYLDLDRQGQIYFGVVALD